MQALIPVGFGIGDVVVKAAGHRFEHVVHDAQRPVAVIQLGHDDAKTEQVHDLEQLELLLPHLLIDAVNVLFAADDAGTHALFAQIVGQPCLDFLDDFFGVADLGLDRPRQHRVTRRMQVGKGQIFKLGAQRLNTQALGNGGVNIERLAGDAATLFGRHALQRACCAAGQPA